MRLGKQVSEMRVTEPTEDTVPVETDAPAFEQHITEDAPVKKTVDA